MDDLMDEGSGDKRVVGSVHETFPSSKRDGLVLVSGHVPHRKIYQEYNRFPRPGKRAWTCFVKPSPVLLGTSWWIYTLLLRMTFDS